MRKGERERRGRRSLATVGYRAPRRCIYFRNDGGDDDRDDDDTREKESLLRLGVRRVHRGSVRTIIFGEM